MKRSGFFILSLMCLITLLTLFTGCAPTGTDEAVQPTDSPAEAVSDPSSDSEVKETETVDSKDGGTLVISGYSEPTTLDPVLASSNEISQFLGASLTFINPESEIVPYLAESWTISEDILTWTFNLRQDVVYSDGTPLTAQDFVWAYSRALDPQNASTTLAFQLGDVKSIEASDDYTLVMEYNTPNPSLLLNLTDAGYTQPISEASFNSLGKDFGRTLIGTGPFVLKEWVTGDHITIARNPKFNWAPEFAHQGPPYLDEVEFRFIPEYATILAGLEAGDILATNAIQPQDIQRLTDLDEFFFIQTTHHGMWPGLFMNTTIPPFDNLKVRQALSSSIDRISIQQIVYSGLGEIVTGPLNSGTFGFNPEIEQFGYHYDLEKASQLMTEAGYSLNADGIWEKDGQPFNLTLVIGTMDDAWRRMGELMQSQWKDFGIDCQIEMLEEAILVDGYFSGSIAVGMAGWDWPDGGTLLNLAFHSQSTNMAFTNDPEMDALLNEITITADPDKRQEALDAAEKYVLENVYVITTVAKPEFFAINNLLDGVQINPVWHYLYLTEIYFK